MLNTRVSECAVIQKATRHPHACVRASVYLELSVHHQETLILEVNVFKVSVCHRCGWIKVPNVESLARI